MPVFAGSSSTIHLPSLSSPLVLQRSPLRKESRGHRFCSSCTNPLLPDKSRKFFVHFHSSRLLPVPARVFPFPYHSGPRFTWLPIGFFILGQITIRVPQQRNPFSTLMVGAVAEIDVPSLISPRVYSCVCIDEMRYAASIRPRPDVCVCSGAQGEHQREYCRKSFHLERKSTDHCAKQGHLVRVEYRVDNYVVF